MRRSILILVLCTLSLSPLFSQEAFYIYRNDGDFNGFFYDEVQEMRYSKFALDSTEYEQYVTCEVVLADTIYRIPLAAIDSIGFQQPEIKFKPKVKFVEREGLSPYINQVSEYSVKFLNLPSDLIPQVGDVLIGFPTDAIAKEKYQYVGGSFSCVIAGIENKEDGSLVVSGLPVGSLADVFDQFISVEEIGVDQQGNVRRRIAGCTPDGFPRKAPAASGEGELNLIDVSGTFTRSWEPADNCNVDLSADVNLKVKLRAAYNITWRRFMTTLSQEFITQVKPSFGLSYSRGFELEAEDFLPVPIGEIVFPAACPIFAINPIPSLFVRGEGKAEARLNMPAVSLGIGMQYTYNTDELPFPLSCKLLLSEGEDKELTEEMLDLSGELSLSGYVQTGIKFSGDIFTASWMKRILRSSIGVYLYAGPKVGGTLSLAKADLNGGGLSLYKSLAASNLNVALPSLDLEAKATVSVFSREEKEKTFYNKSWTFFADTVFMAPSFLEPVVEFDNDSMYIELPSLQHVSLGFQRVAAGVKRSSTINPYVAYETPNIPYDRKLEAYEYSIPIKSLRATEYEVYPLVTTWSFAPMEAEPKEIVAVPPTVKFDSDTLVFGATTNLQQSIDITTNVMGSRNIWAPEWLNAEKTVLDSVAGRYRFTISLPPNDRLFDYRVSKETEMYYISASCDADRISLVKKFPFAIHQQANNLQGFTFSFSIHSATCSNMYFNYDYPVTATRVGNNKIHVVGHHVDGNYTYNVDVYLTRLADIEGYSVDGYSASGTVSKTHKYTYYGGDREDPCTGTATETWTATIIPRANDTSVETVKGTYDNRGSGCDAFSSHCEDSSCFWYMSAQVHLP